MPEIVTKAKRINDPELVLMHLIARRFEELSPDAQARVMAWLTAKYGSKES